MKDKTFERLLTLGMALIAVFLVAHLATTLIYGGFGLLEGVLQ